MEKRPGNFREFKLLLPLPESWQYQSNFRTQSHDNSNTHNDTINVFLRVEEDRQFLWGWVRHEGWVFLCY